MKWHLLLLFLVQVKGDEEDFDDDVDDYDGPPDDFGYGGGYGGNPYGGGYGDEGYGDEYGGEQPPSYEVLETKEALEEFVTQDETEPAVFGFFDEERDGEAMAVFKEVSESHRYDFRFALTTDQSVRESYKYDKSPVVTVHLPTRFYAEKFEKAKARFPSAKFSPEALTKFIYKKSLPLVGQKTWKSNDRYDKAHLPILSLFASIDLEKNPKGFDYFANRLRKVAADYKDKMLFNIGDKDDFSYTLEDYGFDDKLENKKDVGVGVSHGDKYYKMTTKFNVDNLRTFVDDVLNGNIEPKIKEAPEYDTEDDDDDSGGDMYGPQDDVVALTAETFESQLQNKDAFLEFYAPWCGHCQSLKPTYKDLATKLKPFQDNIIVAAMDATAHDVPEGYDVSGYPTILFKPKDKSAIPYDDDRDVMSMLDFAAQHASFSLPKDEL